MPAACQVCSAPSCFDPQAGWFTLSKPFLSSGGLQNTRRQALKAVMVSQVNTAGVGDELDSKEPGATSFLINPEETLWAQKIIMRKTDCFEGHCLLTSTFKQSAKQSAKSAKLVSFIQSCC